MTISMSSSGFRTPIQISDIEPAQLVPHAVDNVFALLRPLRAYAMLLLGDQDKADDLLEATLRKAWDEPASARSRLDVRARLFALLRDAALSWHSHGPGRSAKTVFPEPRKDFRDGLALLPIAQRDALLLMVGAGFSSKAASEICGCSTDTLIRRADLARRMLGRVAYLEKI